MVRPDRKDGGVGGNSPSQQGMAIAFKVILDTVGQFY